jgi:alginate O-acetyltransferase complex protein AlgF
MNLPTKPTSLRFVFPFLALLLAFWGGAAHSQPTGVLYDPEPPADSAYVRILVASRETPVDVWVDGKVRIPKLEAGALSEYMVLTAGPHTLALNSSGKPTSTVTSKIDVTNGRAMTVVFTALQAEAKPVLFEDKANSNKLKALLTVYHLSEQTGPLDVTSADGKTKVFAGLTFGTSRSIPVNPIDIELLATQSEPNKDGKEAKATSRVSMTAGGTYSVVLLPTKGGGLIAKSFRNTIERYTGK